MSSSAIAAVVCPGALSLLCTACSRRTRGYVTNYHNIKSPSVGGFNQGSLVGPNTHLGRIVFFWCPQSLPPSWFIPVSTVRAGLFQYPQSELVYSSVHSPSWSIPVSTVRAGLFQCPQSELVYSSVHSPSWSIPVSTVRAGLFQCPQS